VSSLLLAKFKWSLDPHPFARGGSVAIICVCVVHVVMALLLAVDSSAAGATEMTALIYAFQYFLGVACPAHSCLIATMIVSALLALIGALMRIGRVRLAIFFPQHVLLIVMAGGGCWAIVQGAYLDGTVMPRAHIAAGELAVVALCAIHSSAIVRRARDPNG
jgi:hypothetical protein